MDKKVLIAGSKKSEAIGDSIANILKLINVTSDLLSHEDALIAVLSEEYTHVVVIDYDENERGLGGFASYRDILASASGQKIIRCGEESMDYPDYVQYSSMVSRLYELIN